ncbi:urotensin-2 receptor-like [Aquila chrysaetos chrysaetos]|uniref:urotensin-2 receptor-like n=1 Tax=Aquila chrysaetos chrysaetos TaxID=223781 RepID=UPI0011772B2A|nr:urotensin-2 receptor-like [Aquila chrysaetos chrysaetos]
MEPGARISVPCHPKNATAQPNASSRSTGDLLVISFLGCSLATARVAGVVGNISTLVVSVRCTGSTYAYIVALVPADLPRLPAVPSVLRTSFVQDRYFGDLGCRILFSLTRASIFILTVVSTEHHLAVVRPPATLPGSRDHRRAATYPVGPVAFLLAMPTPTLIDPRAGGRATERTCHPRRRMGTCEVYLAILFDTRILAPGTVVCCLYAELPGTCRRSQRALVLSTEETRRCPRQKVPRVVFSTGLAFSLLPGHAVLLAPVGGR